MFPTKILLATDGSAEATRAARMAMTFAESLDSQLFVAYVEPLSDTFASPGFLSRYPDFRDELREIAEREARAKLAKEVQEMREMGEVARAHARIGRPGRRRSTERGRFLRSVGGPRSGCSTPS